MRNKFVEQKMTKNQNRLSVKKRRLDERETKRSLKERVTKQKNEFENRSDIFSIMIVLIL